MRHAAKLRAVTRQQPPDFLCVSGEDSGQPLTELVRHLIGGQQARAARRRRLGAVAIRAGWQLRWHAART